MRGILIDPTRLVVEEVKVEKTLEAIYEAIGASPIDSRMIDRSHAMYFDDEFLLREPLGERWFSFGEHLIGGKALILGVDRAGESVDAVLQPNFVARHISFLVREREHLHLVARSPIMRVPTPGFTITTFNHEERKPAND